jgi:hypothetical protein
MSEMVPTHGVTQQPCRRAGQRHAVDLPAQRVPGGGSRLEPERRLDPQTRPPRLAKRADAFLTAPTGHHQVTFLFRVDKYRRGP